MHSEVLHHPYSTPFHCYQSLLFELQNLQLYVKIYPLPQQLKGGKNPQMLEFRLKHFRIKLRSYYSTGFVKKSWEDKVEVTTYDFKRSSWSLGIVGWVQGETALGQTEDVRKNGRSSSKGDISMDKFLLHHNPLQERRTEEGTQQEPPCLTIQGGTEQADKTTWHSACLHSNHSNMQCRGLLLLWDLHRDRMTAGAPVFFKIQGAEEASLGYSYVLVTSL